MSVSRARQKAERLVNQFGFTRSHTHVDVESIATKLGLAVVRLTLGDDISGMLVVEGDQTTICIAKDQNLKRQRFTIAHEIGHHVLGHLMVGERVHVDRVMMRNSRSSEGTDVREIEANQFAASLLMPEQMVHHAMETLTSRYIEEVIKPLSKQFDVSEQAMAFRLSNLGYEPS